jgi:hypothetical protein
VGEHLDNRPRTAWLDYNYRDQVAPPGSPFRALNGPEIVYGPWARSGAVNSAAYLAAPVTLAGPSSRLRAVPT